MKVQFSSWPWLGTVHRIKYQSVPSRVGRKISSWPILHSDNKLICCNSKRKKKELLLEGLFALVVLLMLIRLGLNVSNANNEVSVYSTQEKVRNVSFVKLVPHLKDDRLIMIEPYVLGQAIGPDRLKYLKSRFDLPEFEFQNDRLTLAMFGHNKADFTDRNDVIEVGRVVGQVPNCNRTSLLHLFIKWNSLKVHIVVFHQVDQFFWIGQIPESILTRLVKLEGFNVHFGKHEEIYDPFGVNQIDLAQFPDEISHFLSQMSTSQYLRCTPDSHNWLTRNQVPISQSKIRSSEEAIIGAKSLMKRLEMHFWVACGTLLGWYRQCHVTPYTSDTDFATWAKYLSDGNITTSQLKKISPKHNLQLTLRFGEPSQSMEYSFASAHFAEKVDLFFIYPNGSHFLLPFHMTANHTYSYSIYPKYKLCSIQLLGYKLLAPCDPERVILSEYGPEWHKPISNWIFSDSPHNSAPPMSYSFPGNQYEQFQSLTFLLPFIVDIVLCVLLVVLFLFLIGYCYLACYRQRQ